MSNFKLGDYDINSKARNLINAWAIGRNPNSWKNPNEFYPERFADNVIDFMGHNFELIPFGPQGRNQDLNIGGAKYEPKKVQVTWPIKKKKKSW